MIRCYEIVEVQTVKRLHIQTQEQTCNNYFCYLVRLCTYRPWCCQQNCRWEMYWAAEQCSIHRWSCVLQWCHPWVPCCLCLQLHPSFGGLQVQRMSEQWELEWLCSTVCCWLVTCYLFCPGPCIAASSTHSFLHAVAIVMVVTECPTNKLEFNW